MWLPGHLALSFLLCFPLIVMVKRERLLAFYYVAFFALFPDFIHIGELRIVSHSIAGLTAMLLITFVILFILFRPRPIMYIIGAVAAIGHLLGDLYIGSIHPFWPFDDTWYHFHQFNTTFDIITEVMLSSIVLILIIVLFGPLRLYVSRRQLDRSENKNLYLFASLVMIMTLLQGGYYAYTVYLGNGDFLQNLLLFFFAIPLLYTVSILLPMTFPRQDACNSKLLLSSSGMRKL